MSASSHATAPGAAEVGLRKALEAILLIVEEPVEVAVLAEVAEADPDAVTATLHALAAEYAEADRGFVLREAAGGWRLYTDPATQPLLERFVQHGRRAALSQAALETLAIVAYQQPVTRGQISSIRGVDADGSVRTLLARGLIEEVGRETAPGQPLLYGTSRLFLEQLGLASLAELPSLPDLDPGGPAPPEPAPGGYRAARRALAADDRGRDAADDSDPAP